MYPAWTAGLACLVAFYIYTQVTSLRRNIAAAKASGLAYKVVTGSLLTPSFLLPFLDRVPRAWTEGWIPLIVLYRTWHAGYAPFADVGADTFIAVSLTHNALWTCDPEVVLQISKSKDEFPKATKSLAVLNVYGPTVTGTDGAESRLYRKITQPAFNERTLAIVWSETIAQTIQLLEHYRDADGAQSVDEHGWRSETLGEDAARMTLNIMSKVCFGQESSRTGDLQGSQMPTGHRLRYHDALSQMLHNILLVFALPHWLLRISPLDSHRTAWTAFCEWRQYMEEMQHEQEAELALKSQPSENPNLLEALVQARVSSSDSKQRSTRISQPSVMGNMFIFLLAGHETSASTLQFALTCLACYPQYQRLLQASIDASVGQRGPESWNYTRDFPLLYKRFPGAVLAETIRLFTVLPFLLRTTNDIPQAIRIGDKTHMVPPHTAVMVNTSAVHRHPKHWKRTRPADEAEAAPRALSDFDPTRWLTGSGDSPLDERELKPVAGTYVPFSLGNRSCIGSRFAEVEVVAMLATIFQRYSVELATDGTGPEAWNRARSVAQSCLNEKVGFRMALCMTQEVPLRIVQRGRERFD